ncbi:hypothetical protein BRC82_10480 [Halobacteriales archaeon QS_1_67_19]|nr:MAG: hypothetical protein BRC82_10480 [Halobacteriales archaeon QS_1_67_19]
MATQGMQDAAAESTRLPAALPFGLPAASYLGWELGSRVTAEEGVTARQTWEHRDSGRTLTVYDATEHTVILGVRTPAGRERFFGAAAVDLEPRLARLEAADDWRRRR